MSIGLFFRLLIESVTFALRTLWLNKLRTFLSVLGITVGIFSIILVFTLTDSMEKNVRNSVESLGTDVVFVQKWPWEFGEDYPWWKYMNRPTASKSEEVYLSKRLSDIAYTTFQIRMMPTNLKFASNAVEGVYMMGVGYEWNKIRSIELQNGRYFTEEESAAGHATCIIGAALANGLFGEMDPIGRIIKAKSKKLKVVGVFKKEGESLLQGTSLDNQMVVPVMYARNLVNLDDDRLEPTVMVKAKEGTTLLELEQEVRGKMRAIRKLKPGEADNFALNKITLISKGLDSFFGVMGIAGWIIGGLATLVGGFGIANIMFVSVQERTQQIGIQKSLGARNSFILFQFLVESITLTLIGGVLGILLVYGVTQLTQSGEGAKLVISLSYKNIILGTFMSIGIGIVFGIIPAYSASRLSPVEAIRSGI